MKTFLRNTLVIATLAVGANGLMAAQATSNEPTLKQLVNEAKSRRKRRTSTRQSPPNIVSWPSVSSRSRTSTLNRLPGMGGFQSTRQRSSARPLSIIACTSPASIGVTPSGPRRWPRAMRPSPSN
jgi:hypothetical protein